MIKKKKIFNSDKTNLLKKRKSTKKNKFVKSKKDKKDKNRFFNDKFDLETCCIYLIYENLRGKVNNVLCTVTSKNDLVMLTESAGRGFKNRQKISNLSLKKMFVRLLEKIKYYNLEKLNYNIAVRGINNLQKNNLKFLISDSKLHINSLINITPIVFNGHRPSRKKRK